MTDGVLRELAHAKATFQARAIVAAMGIWPTDVLVPPRPILGPRFAPEGTEEGDLCFRDGGCQGRLELRPNPETNGCSCHLGGAPCGLCMSYTPECPKCGWRGEEYQA